MGDLEVRRSGRFRSEQGPVNIFDVLGVDLCARAILEFVPVEDLVRSERVSRRWQTAVLHHLRTCRTLSYEGFCYPDNYGYQQELTTTYHRTIAIGHYMHSMPLVRKTLHKWGPYITKVITDIGKGKYLDAIVSKCPNLEQIEIVLSDRDKRCLIPTLTPIKKLKQLKQIVLQSYFSYSRKIKSDLVFGELFQDINCENIAICHTDDFTGSCLKSLKPDVLKSLTLRWCDSLRVSNLLSAIDNMRKITSMELGGCNDLLFTDGYLLLIQMPQLEELSLDWFSFDKKPISKEWIHAFSQLGNLKRLNMVFNHGRVTDAFLEELARGCKNLEDLKIIGSTETITARGVTALCRRSSSARTTLHFPPGWVVEDYASRFSTFKDTPLYRELAALGCVELTLEWFTAACRDPRGRELPLNPGAEDYGKNLKLIIFL